MSFGGNPADIKLPNRRTARDASPKFQNEIHNIRDELAAIQEDLNQEIETDTAQASLEDEVTSLYHDLQRAAGKLEQEKAARKRIESELEQIRSGRLRETADVVQELEKKRTELNTLREERTMMKEWLDRGVAECKRVADEVTKLKQELEVSEKSCAALSKDKHKLANMVQQLTEELSTVQLALEKVHHEKSVLEIRAEEGTGVMTRAEDQRRNAVSEADRLSSEVVRLSQRVRGLEDAELSMQSMCSCIEALCQEINMMDRNITSGRLDDPAADLSRPPLQDAANNIQEPKSLPVMVIDAKRLLQHLQDSLGRLRVSTKRFVADKERKYTEIYRQRQAEIENMNREKEIVVQRYSTETEQYKKRVGDLEREIMHVAEGVQRDMTHEANERLAGLDRLTGANRELTGGNERLKEENDKLRAKAKRMKIDWKKVDESRRRFQQLQVEVELMKEYCDKLTMENRNLKMIVETQPTGGVRGSPSQGYSATMPGAPSFYSPDTEGNMMQTHRQAFEEWRNSTLRSTQFHQQY